MDAIGLSINRNDQTYAFSTVLRLTDVLALVSGLNPVGIVLFIKVAFLWESLSPLDRAQLLLDVVTFLELSASRRLTLVEVGEERLNTPD